MKKVLLIRASTTRVLNGGIDKHCQALKTLFAKDEEIEILPIVNLKFKYLKCIHKEVLDWNALRNVIASSGCDVVHVHGFASFVVPQSIYAAKLCGKKIVYTAHYHPASTLDHPFLGRMFFSFLLKPLLKYVDVFVALNNEDENVFRKYVKRIYKIPHWTKLSPLDIDIRTKKNNMLLFVGRNRKNKGVEHLLSLPQNKYEVHCVCGNTTIERDDFICHHNISEEELSRLYAETSLLLVPSRYEAFSLVSLEAFMHHTPVLMSDRVRIADYLAGCSGYRVFPYGDFKSFNEEIPIAQNEKVDVERISRIFSEGHAKEEYRKVYSFFG